MCNLFSNTMAVDAMRRLFDVPPERDHLGNHPPLTAIFPRHEAPVVRRAGDGARELVRMHWGFLMPQVSKRTGEPILPRAVNNARDDKIRTSPFWRESFERRRCLIPATSFCEPKGRKPAIYHWFGVEGPESRTPFAFAGFWRTFRGNYRDDLVTLDTVTMVTGRPNALVAPVHPDRMPVILPQEAWETWLTAPPDAAADLLRPYPAEAMRLLMAGEDRKEDAA